VYGQCSPKYSDKHTIRKVEMSAECRACGSSQLKVLVDFGLMPLAGGFLANDHDQAAEELYPLVVHICEVCALVQICDPIDHNILFRDYSFSASTIPGLVHHFGDYAAWLHQRFHPDRVVEFGANDGVLLSPLASLGIRAVGVDVSENITQMARQRGHDVITAAFTPDIATQIRESIGRVDLVTGSNAFAHNADPGLILEASEQVLTEGGRLCLELMYSGDLYEQLQWDTLYHEHLTFYGLSQLLILLRRYGFEVEHAERIPMHGGSLRVVAARLGEASPDASVRELLEYEERLGITDAAKWHDFAQRSLRTIDVVKTVFEDLRPGRHIWAYGAAGKATMWVNACKLDYLEGVVDASPLRAGKRMPGTHTPICSPEEFRNSTRPDVVLVTAWNYLDAIRKGESWYGGLWAVPLPSLSFS